jgi:Uma2 family endonuclease
MAREYAVIPDDHWLIPPEAFTFEGFQRWLDSGGFPETERIDFLAGQVETEMSPEDLHTHSVVKTAIGLILGALIYETGLGDVYVDSTHLTSKPVGLSVERISSWSSGKPWRRAERPSCPPPEAGPLEWKGRPTLFVEIVRDSSVKKDNQRLPRLYARAGLPELWIADCRWDALRFEIRTLQDGRYAVQQQDGEGWVRSPLLNRSFRLVRWPSPPFPWRYRLEHRSAQTLGAAKA